MKKTTMTCSMSGVPRMTQTNVLVTARTVRHRLIEQNDKARPSGSEHASVTAKVRQVSPNP
jgi:hypothetical protein